MIFKTELDRPATYNITGVDTAYKIPDNVSYLGTATKALYPLKRPPSYTYKARRRSPL